VAFDQYTEIGGLGFDPTADSPTATLWRNGLYLIFPRWTPSAPYSIYVASTGVDGNDPGIAGNNAFNAGNTEPFLCIYMRIIPIYNTRYEHNEPTYFFLCLNLLKQLVKALLNLLLRPTCLGYHWYRKCSVAVVMGYRWYRMSSSERFTPFWSCSEIWW